MAGAIPKTTQQTEPEIQPQWGPTTSHLRPGLFPHDIVNPPETEPSLSVPFQPSPAYYAATAQSPKIHPRVSSMQSTESEGEDPCWVK